MQKIDELLLTETKGRVGNFLEEAIERICPCHREIDKGIFGSLLALDSILITEENAKNIIYSTVQEYWGNIDLFLHSIFQTTTIDIENANDRLRSFLASENGKKAIFDYLLIHNYLEFDNLIALAFGKDIKLSIPAGGLHEIHLFQVGNKFLLHIIYNDKSKFWDILFAKKIYSIFLQTPLQTIVDVIQLIHRYKNILEKHYSLNQSVVITNNLIKKLDLINVRSYELKELHLFNLILHFNGGKRHYKKLTKLIEGIMSSWGKGKWALSEKENTLLIYMLAVNASQQNNIKKVIEYGRYLIHGDRLINHSIELLVEYSDVLPNLKPEPATIVKRYNKNYLEQIFYILIDALIQNEQFDEVISLLRKHDIASCTSIYDYFNAPQFDQDLLHRIEATVQRDIAYIVHNSPQHVLQSIEIWLAQYQDEKSPYFEIAIETSNHVCNLLKVFFATEQYELFEKLIEVYKKYLKIETHFYDLRDFVSKYVKS
ncbi:hypothetical protein SAMN05880501_11539 [Ureibacillus xyleni]|uniref:Uncharacterized protein n=1 Tax=Ureibacillus xyleni TaxID=614648 RepID=A0A285TL73_9BACL|nr:hypothetical protein [Ureibacillus xyleni]SOC23270.1 hypothetical protein SAMN05880501_11539 [Ureibacillus xyleni]